ncbi:hypothetical protein CP532_5980 [Ophiocordyceps camponoti-leonardi (nom. inval.)]|nr:hypothetical protein CP532_5980 [Ophiocordyceps camponoti-leonardi (nom. inval.)]
MASSSSSSASSISRPFKYKWIERAERLEKYCKGGYHPVEIGDVLHDGRYEIVNKLGFGGWSTVWLARDSVEKRYVALKVGLAASTPNETPNETHALRALEMVAGFEAIPRLLDEFWVKGPNGSHPCFTTKPALYSLSECSDTLLFPLDVARALAYELALAVAHVHSNGWAHGDIHLRNMLIRARSNFDQLSSKQFSEKFGKPEIYPVERMDGTTLRPGVPSTIVIPCATGGKSSEELILSDAFIVLNDFGEAFIPESQSRLGVDCHTPPDYRPPDTYLQPDVPLSFSADIWSLALAFWDLLGMEVMFESDFGSLDSIVAQVVDTLGPLPDGLWEKWERKKRIEYFNDDGTPTAGRDISSKLEQRFEEAVQEYRREEYWRKHNLGEVGIEETGVFLDLMRRMLKVQPEERITIDEVLQSEWMTKWAKPEYDRSRSSTARVET